MRWFWQKGREKSGAGDDAPERVRVFDFDTRRMSTIPAAELTPGMVCVRMDGVEGDVWVDGSRLQQNVFQHPQFSEEVRDRLRQLQAALGEVYPMSLEQWEDGFRRDRNPDKEIEYWLHLARTYARLTAPDDPLGSTPERRRGVFQVLVGCGVAPREQVLSVAERGLLTREEAERILTAFYGESG